VNPEKTVAAIDAAIDGWTGPDLSVSSCAMRWAPEPPPSPNQPAGEQRGTPLTVSEATALIGEVISAWIPPNAPEGLYPEAIHSLAEVHANIERASAAFTRKTQLLSETWAKATHEALAQWHYGGKYRRHRRGCRICNPHGNPPPAPSSMRAAEYTRRLRHRRRRNRKR